MTNKQIALLGLIMGVVFSILSSNVFVSYPQMQAYAVSKDSMQLILDELHTIEIKIDKLSEEN